MELLTWTPLIFTRNGFPRDEAGRPFLPGNVVKEGIVSAVIYYYIKKDKEVESKVKAYLLKKGLKPNQVIERVKEIILNKYPVLEGLEVPERIELSNGELYQTTAEVFNLKRWEEEESFKVEVFRGVVELPIASPYLDKLKAAGHSFCEALAKMEMSLLKEHPLVEVFYKPLLNEIKKWEIPLRLGMWSQVPFKGALLYFWRIKEVRNALMEELKVDIRPTKVIYLPREKCTTGWCEVKL